MTLIEAAVTALCMANLAWVGMWLSQVRMNAHTRVLMRFILQKLGENDAPGAADGP